LIGGRGAKSARIEGGSACATAEDMASEKKVGFRQQTTDLLVRAEHKRELRKSTMRIGALPVQS